MTVGPRARNSRGADGRGSGAGKRAGGAIRRPDHDHVWLPPSCQPVADLSSLANCAVDSRGSGRRDQFVMTPRAAVQLAQSLRRSTAAGGRQGGGMSRPSTAPSQHSVRAAQAFRSNRSSSSSSNSSLKNQNATGVRRPHSATQRRMQHSSSRRLSREENEEILSVLRERDAERRRRHREEQQKPSAERSFVPSGKPRCSLHAKVTHAVPLQSSNPYVHNRYDYTRDELNKSVKHNGSTKAHIHALRVAYRLKAAEKQVYTDMMDQQQEQLYQGQQTQNDTWRTTRSRNRKRVAPAPGDGARAQTAPDRQLRLSRTMSVSDMTGPNAFLFSPVVAQHAARDAVARGLPLDSTTTGPALSVLTDTHAQPLTVPAGGSDETTQAADIKLMRRVPSYMHRRPVPQAGMQHVIRAEGFDAVNDALDPASPSCRRQVF